MEQAGVPGERGIHLVLRRRQATNTLPMLRTLAPLSFDAVLSKAKLGSHITLHMDPDVPPSVFGDQAVLGSAVHLHTIQDFACTVAVTYQPASHSLLIRPSNAFMPSCRYTVIIDGSPLGGYLDTFVSFTAQDVGPVRIVAQRRDTDNTMLATISRSVCLLTELQAKIAVRIPGILARQVVGISCVGDDTRPPFQLASDYDVCNLQDGDVVQFDVLDTVPPEPTDDQQRGPPMFSKEYIEQHWVSAAAGYYVVAGKMSAEEENMLLLSVVNAFKDTEDVSPAISCEMSARMAGSEPVVALGPTIATREVDDIVAGTGRPQSLNKPQNAQAVDATMSYIPAEIIENPWTNGLQRTTPSLRYFSSSEIQQALGGDHDLAAQVL